MMKKLAIVGILFLSMTLAFAQFSDVQIADSQESRYGAHIDGQGWVHFVVYSPEAEAISLLLFGEGKDLEPSREIAMNKHGEDWRVKVRGSNIGHGLFYMYRANGPFEISVAKPYGKMFHSGYFLNDPYAYKNQNVSFSKVFRSIPLVDTVESLYAGGGKSVVYDHSRDIHPGHQAIPQKDLIVYELHVQDYTSRIQNLDSSKRGTYLGLAQSGLTTPGGLTAGIDHLVELGVNAVELMPVMEYDEETGNLEGRYNHWGYMTTNFFTPEARYASQKGEQVIELKKLVKAFHDKGIAVFMDVVYNHTAEQSPWTVEGKLAAKYYNFMGLANTAVYRSTNDKKFYFNNTGTGNDVEFFGGDRFSKRWAQDSLALWHQTYGIDGFRFDLARILADGSANAADWIDNDSRYQKAHLHAEPWDMGGVWWEFMDSGSWNYTNNRWTKWLGRYRDNIRKFSSSNLRSKRMFKRLIEGRGANSDGGTASTKPWRSINLISVHDGYTMRDITYYNDFGGSHNCWDSNGDENLRRERQKLMMGVLLTSQGIPLILQGDEFGRTKSSALTQDEAHNTYNYESSEGDTSINNVNWIDWRLKDGDNSSSPQGPRYGNELFNWTKNLISLRKTWTHFRRDHFVEYVAGFNSGGANDGKYSYIWENTDGEPAQIGVIWWGNPGEPDIAVIYNESWENFTINNLGDWSQGDWKVLARSWYGAGADFGSLENWQSNPDAGNSLLVKSRSVAILISDND